MVLTLENPARSALLLVDLQHGTCGDDSPPRPAGFHERFRRDVLPQLEVALASCREHSLEVVHTVIANLTADGRDRSRDYKACGLGFPPGSRAAEVIPELAPTDDEVVLPKTSSSAFNSTTLDYVLRNMDIDTLVVGGLLTDQCIDHTIKDAADLGYRVICLRDGVLAETPERHAAGLLCSSGYCEQVDTAELLAALNRQPG